MKEFIGFIKGFGAAIWLVLGALMAIIGWLAGMYTAAGIDNTKPRKPVNYNSYGRGYNSCKRK
jgi:hypothetical protein